MKRYNNFIGKSFLKIFLVALFSFSSLVLKAESEPNITYQTSDTLQLSVLNSGTVDNSADKIDWWILPQTNGVYKIRFKTDQKVTFTLYGNNPTKSYTSFTLSNVLDTTFTFPYTGAQYITVSGAVGVATYSLTATYIDGLIAPDDAEPNNDTISSIPLEIGVFKEGNLGYINSTYDASDYYSVTLPEDGYIKLTVIYNDLMVINPFFNGITNAFHKGKYHFSVLSPTGFERCHYKIKAEFEPINYYANDTEPNDEIVQAKPVDIRNDITGKVGLMINAKKMDAQDLYTFTLAKDTSLILRFLKDKFLDGALILYLENSLNYIFPDKNGLIKGVFKSGKYYMKVFSPTNTGGSYCISIKDSEKIPIADFDYQVVGKDVYFNEKVDLPCNFLWDFGDGTTSTLANPVHRFSDYSYSNVIFTAWNNAGKHLVKKQVLSNGISDFNPYKSGNKGYVTMKITGRGFTQNSVVKLTATGKNDIVADSVKLNDDASLYCRFDLHDKTPGQYTVTVNNESIKYESSKYFAIEQGGAPKIDVSIVGRDVIRKGTKTKYTLFLKNSGTVDALGIPLFIAISEDAEIEFTDLKITLSKYAIDRGIKFDTVPVFIKTKKVLGEDFNAKVYAFYIHNLPAGKVINRRIDIQSDSNVKILVWTNKPYFGSPMRGEVADCMLDLTAEAMTDQLIGLIPGASCAKSIYENVVEPVFSDEESAEESTVGSMIWDYATLAWDCTTSFFTPAKALDFAVSLVTTIVDINGFSDNMQDCYNPEGKNGNSINAVSSLDPNEKNGPHGYGVENCINKTENLPYVINFENKSTATAPAQEVFVTDTLDTAVYDAEKFSFTAFGFADTTVYFNGFNQNIIRDVDLRPKKNLIVRLTAQFNKENGIANWSFRSFDPQTMDLPEDPYAGFLSPNNTNHDGEGFVSFNVALNENVIDGTIVKNKAAIVFDKNSPIITNEYSNRLDFSSPESKLTSMKSTQLNDYRLEFSGSDPGSGIQHYKVYCSVNDSAYKLLKTTSTPIEKFTVEKGKTVKLYSLAVDSLGYVETKTAIPDLTLSYLTGLDKNSLSADINAFPQPVNDVLNISSNKSVVGNAIIKIYDLTGNCLIEQINMNYSNNLKINVSSLKSGLYILVLNHNSEVKHLSFIKQ